MKIVRFLALLVIVASPPAFLMLYDGDQFLPGSRTAAPADTSDAGGNDAHDQAFEAALDRFTTSYQEEFEAYRQEISARWGEFKEASSSTWVSYDGAGEVRRTVDYRSGSVEVELIVGTDKRVEQVLGQLDRAVDRLMNTTQAQAYAADVVANRVERRLADLGNLLQTGQLSKERLFSREDLAALEINRSGFLKVNSGGRNAATTDVRAAAKPDSYIVRASFSIPHTIHEKAVKYAAAVATAADKERINDELIYAIIETESSFNPMAKSHIPAYGLMQIVPHTAGRDATRHLYGKPRLLAPSYLYNPNNNIKVGAAYLHVLHYKYMRRVKNTESRMYCAIAAYNTGASNVARAFIDRASFNEAVSVINQLSPSEVYDKLRNYLPLKETRMYIEKVSKRMEKYL